jgi:hypothetical protein
MLKPILILSELQGGSSFFLSNTFPSLVRNQMRRPYTNKNFLNNCPKELLARIKKMYLYETLSSSLLLCSVSLQHVLFSERNFTSRLSFLSH